MKTIAVTSTLLDWVMQLTFLFLVCVLFSLYARNVYPCGNTFVFFCLHGVCILRAPCKVWVGVIGVCRCLLRRSQARALIFLVLKERARAFGNLIFVRLRCHRFHRRSSCFHFKYDKWSEYEEHRRVCE